MFGLSKGTKHITLEQAEQLNMHFKQFIDGVNSMMNGAIRHSISETLNTIRDLTRANISSSPFNSTSPIRPQKNSPGGALLMMGAQAYMVKGNNVGFVHILGTQGNNDGTWMLRFYEGGTVERTHKNNKSVGHLEGYHFFRGATSNIDSLFYNEATKNINKTAKEING